MRCQRIAAEIDGALEGVERFGVVRAGPSGESPHAVTNFADIPPLRCATGGNVSEIGYGMWGLADGPALTTRIARRPPARRRSRCNFFDTAWAYGEGGSEQILGKSCAPTPERKLYVARKFRPKNGKWPSRRDFTLDDCYPPDHIEALRQQKPRQSGRSKNSTSSSSILGKTAGLNDERLPRAVEKLRATGKAEAVGVSVNRWEPCNGIRAVLEGVADAVQVIYNIFDQNPEDALFPICRMKDVAVMPAYRSMKAPSPARSPSIARGQKAIGATLISSRKI